MAKARAHYLHIDDSGRAVRRRCPRKKTVGTLRFAHRTRHRWYVAQNA